jgi:hypothetical protein
MKVLLDSTIPDLELHVEGAQRHAVDTLALARLAPGVQGEHVPAAASLSCLSFCCRRCCLCFPGLLISSTCPAWHPTPCPLADPYPISSLLCERVVVAYRAARVAVDMEFAAVNAILNRISVRAGCSW